MIAEIELNRTDSREHPRFKARGLVLVVGETAGATALFPVCRRLNHRRKRFRFAHRTPPASASFQHIHAVCVDHAKFLG